MQTCARTWDWGVATRPRGSGTHLPAGPARHRPAPTPCPLRLCLSVSRSATFSCCADMEDPAERKARLKALRKAAAEAGEVPEQQPAQAEPVLKFRNYVVQDQKHVPHQQVRDCLRTDISKPRGEPILRHSRDSMRV